MSRTFRNRHSAPKGFKVRDGIPWKVFDSYGNEYYLGDSTRTEIKQIKFYSNNWTFGGQIGLSILQAWSAVMFANRKYEREVRWVKKFRASRYSREDKIWRRLIYKGYRAGVRGIMAHDDWEQLPVVKGTCGWKTW